MDSFSVLLLSWYKKNARKLPWRETSDPYKIWISEVMLQQTTVNAVIPYYERWIKTFPSVEDVAQSKLEKILKLWQGLGYYQRAQNVYKAAQMIVKDYHGKIPNNPEQLRNLPGFGPYTTGAVLSIAFNQRQPIIDANVRRVFMRILNKKGHADTTQDGDILTYLLKILPHKDMKYFNQSLMELGALVCRNREPVCLLCPVRKFCKAYKYGTQEIIPEIKKKTLKNQQVVIGILKKGSKYFIQKRPSKGLLANLWEFPGGKVEPKETLQKALKRELKEELNVELSEAKFFMETEHFYTQFRVYLHVFICEIKGLIIEDADHRMVDLNELVKYPMPSGSSKIVDRILAVNRP
jgi:A/G-specific adenine glycosylase